MDWKDYLIEYRKFKLPIFLIGWGADYADPHNFVYTFMHSQGVYGRYMAYQNDEVDRLCDAMIAIREEIRAIEEGRADREDNVLQNAPHTASAVTSDDWSHPYSREEAAFPTAWARENKFWPASARVDNGYGDRNLICACPPPEAWITEATEED